MSDKPSYSTDTAIRAVVDEFGELLSDGQQPSIADFLQRLSTKVQPVLFAELLAYDVGIRDRSPEDIDFYLGKFPEHGNTVKAVFERLESSHAMIRAGRYFLLQRIGTGGMGDVYEALDTKLGRRVALKAIAMMYRNDDVATARFNREISSIADLNDPGVITLYDSGRFEGGAFHGRLFYTMECFSGSSLSSLLQQEAEFGPRDAAQIVAKTARALAAAHAAGILHRDVKPDNVLVGPDHAVKLIDFGLALRTNDSGGFVTQDGRILGTSSYISPEMAHGTPDKASPATDVYGLGALLYTILARRPPFDGPTDFANLQSAMASYPPPPSHWNSRVPWELDLICEQCMRKDPTDRIVSAEAVAAELDRWLADMPLTIRPPSIARRCQLWYRRHTVLTWLCATALMSCVLGVSNWATSRESRQLASSVKSLRRSANSAEAEKQRLANLELCNYLNTKTNLIGSGQSERRTLHALLAADVAELLQVQHPAVLANLIRNTPAQAGLDVLSIHGAAVTDVAASRDGRWMLTADSENGRCCVWDLHNDLNKAGEFTSPSNRIDRVGISPNGHWITMHDTSTNKLFLGSLTDTSGPLREFEAVTGYRFSEDSEWLFTGYAPRPKLPPDTKQVSPSQVLNLLSFTPKTACYKAPTFESVEVPGLRMINVTSPDGTLLASADAGSSVVKLFRQEGSAWKRIKTCSRPSGSLFSSSRGQIHYWAFSPDGRWLFGAWATDPRLYAWQLEPRNDDRPGHPVVFEPSPDLYRTKRGGPDPTGHRKDAVTSFAVYPDSSRVLVLYQSGRAMAWPLRTKPVEPLFATSKESVYPYGTPEFAGSTAIVQPHSFRSFRDLICFDMDGEELLESRLTGCLRRVAAVSVHAETATIAAATEDGDIHVWGLDEDFVWSSDKQIRLFAPRATIASRDTPAKTMGFVHGNSLLLTPESRWNPHRPFIASVHDFAYYPASGETKLVALPSTTQHAGRSISGARWPKEYRMHPWAKREIRGMYGVSPKSKVIASISFADGVLEFSKHVEPIGMVDIGKITESGQNINWVQATNNDRAFVGFGDNERIEVIKEVSVGPGGPHVVGSMNREASMVCCAPQGRWLLSVEHSGHKQGVLRLDDLTTKKSRVLKELKRWQWIRSMAFTPDGRWLVAQYEDGNHRPYQKGLWIWKTQLEVDDGSCHAFQDAGEIESVTDSWIVATGVGRLFAIKLNSTGASLVDVEDGVYYRDGHFAVSDQGLMVANGPPSTPTGSSATKSSAAAYRYDPSGNSLRRAATIADQGETLQTKFSPDGKLLARVQRRGTEHVLLLWKVVGRELQFPPSELKCSTDRKKIDPRSYESDCRIAFTSDSKNLIVASSFAARLFIWDMTTDPPTEQQVPIANGESVDALHVLSDNEVLFRTESGTLGVIPIRRSGWANRLRLFVGRDFRTDELSDETVRLAHEAILQRSAVDLSRLATRVAGSAPSEPED